MATNKVIVTNESALLKKYAAAGLKTIQSAISALIAADAVRGLTTVLVRLDVAADMTPTGAKPVTSATDPKQNKMAVDAVFNYYTPDYLMILGAPDVVPHQDLVNPLYSAATASTGDPDPTVPSDLPYASPSPYGTSISDFKNVVRVVGRLPDVTGGTDPNYLKGLLDTASSYSVRTGTAYHTFMGLSAGVWSGSTNLSLRAAFGTAAGMRIIPPSGAPTPALLANPSHFVNCHGASVDQHFYGQPASGASVYPIALDSAVVAGRIRKGTLMAAECCYGAQLYDPASVTPAIHQPMSNQYLEDGALGFLGSTTVAYGPSATNDWADLMCQYFYHSVLGGASLGRSLLQARQSYITHKSRLTGTDLKTLAQYLLLGDPSITPVAAAAAPSPTTPLMKVGAGFRAVSPKAEADIERATRRQELAQNGLALAASVSTSGTKSRAAIPSSVMKILRNQAKDLELVGAVYSSFKVELSEALDTARTLTFAKGMPAKLADFAGEAAPRRLKAVHHVIGHRSKRPGPTVNLSGAEVVEYDDGVTIHPFESR
jgi:hypothetical protein